METITKYRADDGAEFATTDDCLAYENLAAEVATVMAKLPPLPKNDGCRFANGHGFIQHDPATAKEVRDALLRMGMRYVSDPPWFQQTIDGDAHPSWAGRLMDEGCPRPLSLAWHRFQCMDQQWREWGQPYYANHPDQAEQVCIAMGTSA